MRYSFLSKFNWLNAGTSGLRFPLVIAPFGGQAWLRGQQNFEDRAPGVAVQVGELGALIATGQDFEQPVINILLSLRGQGIERLVVDEVTAWILENSGTQIEVAQRAPLRVARAARAELLGIAGIPFDLGFQRRFVGEEQI